MVRHVAILGREFAIDIRTPALEEWFAQNWIFPEHSLPPVPFIVALTELDGPPVSRDGALTRVALHRTSLECIGGDGCFTFGDATAGVRLEVEDAGSRIAVWGASKAASLSAIFAALFVSIGESLRASGLLPLHGAVVVDHRGATALVGRSGVGKSTTLWRAIQIGWAPLAEDFAWLDPVTLTVYGWDRGLRLTTDSRARFAPDSPLDRFRTDDDGKLFLSYDQVGGVAARSATLTRVVVLERDAASNGDAGLSASEMVRAWWEAVGVPLSPVVVGRVSGAIASLVRRVPTQRLHLDDGPLAL